MTNLARHHFSLWPLVMRLHSILPRQRSLEIHPESMRDSVAKYMAGKTCFRNPQWLEVFIPNAKIIYRWIIFHSYTVLDCQRVSGATDFYSISFGTGIILANDTMIYSVCKRFSEVHHRHLLKPFTPFTRQCTQSSLFYHLGHAVALADSCTAVLFSPSVSASGYPLCVTSAEHVT